MTDQFSSKYRNEVEYSLLDIINVEDLQKLQDSFAKANGVASTIVDIYGFPITKPSNHSPVCKLIRATEKGQKKCIQSGEILGNLALKSDKPSFHVCRGIGFVDAAAPIVIEGRHIANWLIGQTWTGDVDEKRIVAYAEQIGACEEEMLQAFRSMNTNDESEFIKKLDFLWLMANQISNQAYQQIRYKKTLQSLEKSQAKIVAYKNNLEEIVNERTAELELAIKKIKKISIKDALTGCFNRGAINKSLPNELSRAKRYNCPISILLCDLDHFKRVNDSYGHQSGDVVLKEVVTRIQRQIRDSIDWLARYGGEEFLLVMPHTNSNGAAILAERLRKEIESIPFYCSEEKVHITASFGLVSIDNWNEQEDLSYEALLYSADVYLYRAKNEGRNRIISGHPICTIDSEHNLIVS